MFIPVWIVNLVCFVGYVGGIIAIGSLLWTIMYIFTAITLVKLAPGKRKQLGKILPK